MHPSILALSVTYKTSLTIFLDLEILKSIKLFLPWWWKKMRFKSLYHEWCMYNCCCLVAQSCLTLCSPRDFSLPGPSVYGIFSGKNTRVGCHFLLQGIFPTEGSNPHLLHCRRILYHWAHLYAATLQFAPLVSQMVKNLPATQEMRVWSLGRGDPLEKGMATHSALAWRIPWIEEPGWLQSMGSQRVRHHWATNIHMLQFG